MQSASEILESVARIELIARPTAAELVGSCGYSATKCGTPGAAKQSTTGQSNSPVRSPLSETKALVASMSLPMSDSALPRNTSYTAYPKAAASTKQPPNILLSW